MAKDPAFLFYPNDYIGGTMGMTFEEKGAYIELLMLQFNRGHMTLHMIGQTVGQLWDKLEDKFIEDENGLWYNERLEDEKDKRKNFTESRRNNKSGNNQYTKKKKKQSGHMTSHMENENENEDINKSVDRIYSSYPSKCPIKDSSTGKTKSNKVKIKKLLTEHSEEVLINKIILYIEDCKKHKVFIKNFGTFLNNLPDNDNNHSSLQTKKVTSKHQSFDDITIPMPK